MGHLDHARDEVVLALGVEVYRACGKTRLRDDVVDRSCVQPVAGKAPTCRTKDLEAALLIEGLRHLGHFAPEVEGALDLGTQFMRRALGGFKVGRKSLVRVPPLALDNYATGY